MQKDIYMFPCVFIYKEGDAGVSVYFPDLDGCVSFGENEERAYTNAKEALSLHLYGMEQDNEEIPVASKIAEVELESNHRATLLEVYMPTFRAKQDEKFIKKTLTLPNWLNIEAERAGVNFSQLLQNSLKELLGLNVTT